MTVQSDGIDEAFEGQLRVALSVAAQVGQQLARTRENEARRAEQRDAREVAELQSRMDAERQAVRADMEKVTKAEFWNQADAREVADTWQTIQAWKGDPRIDAAAERARQEIQARYGVDPAAPDADPHQVRAEFERRAAEQDRQEANNLMGLANIEDSRSDQARERAEAERAREDVAIDAEQPQASQASRERAHREEDVAAHAADAADKAHDASAVAYDSAERRESTERTMRMAGVDPEAVSVRMRSDVSQGAPATEAATAARRAPLARKGRAPEVGAERQNTGLGR